MRKSVIERNTTETKIRLMLDLDGKGESMIDTGVGFLNHMLTLFANTDDLTWKSSVMVIRMWMITTA